MSDQSYAAWCKEHSLGEYRDEVWNIWRESFTRQFNPVPSMDGLTMLPEKARTGWLLQFEERRHRAWLRATDQWTPEQEREVEQDIMANARRRDISDAEHIRRDDKNVKFQEEQS